MIVSFLKSAYKARESRLKEQTVDLSLISFGVRGIVRILGIYKNTAISHSKNDEMKRIFDSYLGF